ncbi:hypothetical protein DY000_02020556 [Brassica cretica]|uniref:Uncharacterized protein n=1 Tax=Brassica cretica TaxID=69181 RepID=A0ABQ7E5S3_BRACR|nr:hypothetical protein DY000_02020556 [Brassica cretica]
MHGYGMRPGLECSAENWPRSPGELIRATVKLVGRAGPCHGRTRRRVDRQQGHARRASWLVSRQSSPGELARFAAELAGRSVSAGRIGQTLPDIVPEVLNVRLAVLPRSGLWGKAQGFERLPKP